MQSIPPRSASIPPSICTYATTTIHLTARFQCSIARVHHYQQQAPHCSLPAILPTAPQTRRIDLPYSIHTHTNCSESSWTGLMLFLSALPKFTPNSFNSLHQCPTRFPDANTVKRRRKHNSFVQLPLPILPKFHMLPHPCFWCLPSHRTTLLHPTYWRTA